MRGVRAAGGDERREVCLKYKQTSLLIKDQFARELAHLPNWHKQTLASSLAPLDRGPGRFLGGGVTYFLSSLF